MNTVILSKSPYIYSTNALEKALKLEGINVTVINPLECNAGRYIDNYIVTFKGKTLENIDFVIPRIGSASHYYGIYILEILEKAGIKTLNTSQNLLKSRDKYQVYNTLLNNNLPIPESFLVKTSEGIEKLVEKLNGFPVIAKLTRGSQGKGIMIADSLNALNGIIDTISLLGEDLIIQEYFETTPEYSDIRVYILDNKIIGSARRQNLIDFRSNTHCGGYIQQIEIDNTISELALRANNCFNLSFCCIDFLITNEGPKILELNSTPGFEKAEKQALIPLSKYVSQYVKKQLCLTGTTI